MSSQRQAGFTKWQVLVALWVVGWLIYLGYLALPRVGIVMTSSGMTPSLNNMRQLQIATQAMAADGESDGSSLGWPGDMDGSFATWTKRLIEGGYLKPEDLQKLLSAPGRVMPLSDLSQMSESAVLVYAVKEGSKEDAVFLSSANFRNTSAGGVLDPSARPYGKRGFVVFRRGGDGSIYRAAQVGQTNIIGTYAPLCR